jgi:class 3 adenylate cyclase/tetratricopeptide (TPR) repeat protein
MSTTLDEQINQLKQAIAELEEQRLILGDAAVDAALIPSRQKLAELESQSKPSLEKLQEIPTRQRKLVTLLYMDVVGSTAMTQHLDPEDTLEIMDNALPRLAAPIEAHGGHVTRYTGDGFKAVFGDPIAREDDPEQAIRAGLETLDVSKAIAQEIEKEWEIEDFKVRIGIDTGLAALGGQTEAEDTVMGRVVNLAVRIESAAPPGGLLISHNTYRHVRGVFTVAPQEPITAKGFPEPVAVYLVKEIKPRAFRVQTRGVEGVETRMVGRRTEIDTLKDALYTTFEEGEGQVITISGEAGVGKSRLLYEYQNWLELLPSSQGVRFFQGRGSQEAQGLPYSLLRDVFSFRFQILDGDQGEQVRQKVESGFCEVFGGGDDGVMRAHILGQLLGFNFSASSHLKGVLNDAEQLRNRGLMYLIQYFQTLSQEIPVVTFLEDIHWADDSSLDVVSRIGEYTPQHPILFVCAARPILFERRPYWGEGQTYHTCIELHPLSKRESRQLVAEILKLAVDIPAELREMVVNGAEGNPFYTEELIKMLIEDGVVIPDEEAWQIDLTRLEEVDIPSTLAGVLQARLDCLPSQERTVLQQASVVGRLFWDRIVIYIHAEGGNGGDPQLIPQSLTSLRNRELVFRHEESEFAGAVEYLFKHDVLREVTYESVLKRLRKTYHGLVAEWLISNSGDRIREYSSLIAEHLLLAGKNNLANRYFDQAGDSSLASFANKEAEDHYRQALKLSPDDPTRASIMRGLGEALNRQGKSEETQRVWRQAIDLFQELRDYDNLGNLYARLSLSFWHSGDTQKSWKLCREGLKLLEGETESPGYARLLAEAGREAFFANLPDQGFQLCRRAVEMADRVGDLKTHADASITLASHNNDRGEGIKDLKELINFAEKEKLLNAAARAHLNTGAYLDMYLVDTKDALQHNLRAAVISEQIGNLGLFKNAMQNVFVNQLALGELNNWKAIVTDELQGFFLSNPSIVEHLELLHFVILWWRGEWTLALNAFRVPLEKIHQGGNTFQIASANIDLTDILLELDRFDDLNDLSEAEAALEENTKIDWLAVQTHFHKVIVAARMKYFGKAHQQYKLAKSKLSGFDDNMEKEITSRAKFELAFAEQRWKDAVIAINTSIEILKSCGFNWAWARRLIDLGDALVGRNEPDDLERALEIYQQSLDMFTEMGAPGYIKVLEERLGGL